MRLILAGSRSFGAAVYELLDERHDIAAVWSPLDRDDALTTRAGRDGHRVYSQQRTPTAVADLDVDLFVCAHSHDFISAAARRATRLGGIGYHPSLLPRHRGRDAVKWTIHMGDPVTGGSVYWLTDNVDGGPIAAQDPIFVKPGWDASDLWKKELFDLGLELIHRVLGELDSGLVTEFEQDEACATWEPSWERPPLHRPDMIQIGSGVNGFAYRTGKERYQ